MNAGHGGFSALDMYWFLLCSFVKLLLSHSPEAAHSLTLSETHCHVKCDSWGDVVECYFIHEIFRTVRQSDKKGQTEKVLK